MGKIILERLPFDAPESLNRISTLEELDAMIFTPPSGTPWNAEQWEEEIKNKTNSVYLVQESEEGGKKNPIGFFTCSTTEDTTELKKIGLLENKRGEKTGKKIMAFLYENASNKGVKNILIEVSVNNTKAVMFYQNEGFINIHIRKNYYVDHSDALIMGRTI